MVRRVCYDYEEKAVRLRMTKLRQGKKLVRCGISPPSKKLPPDFLLCGNNVPLLFKQLSVAISNTHRQDHPNWQGEKGLGQNIVSTFYKHRVSQGKRNGQSCTDSHEVLFTLEAFQSKFCC